MDRDLRTAPSRTDLPVIEEEMSRTGRTLSVIGFVCAVVALIVLPMLFGAAAIVCGLVGWRSGDRLGLWAAIAGAVCLAGGLAIQSVVVDNARVGY